MQASLQLYPHSLSTSLFERSLACSLSTPLPLRKAPHQPINPMAAILDAPGMEATGNQHST